MGVTAPVPPASSPYDSIVTVADRLVRRLMATQGDRERAQLLGEAEEGVQRALELRPEGVEALYLRAALLGARIERESGATKIRMAQEVGELASRILATDSLHAGAHHLLGRLHAGVMRLGGVTRFLARRLIGGDLLDTASWPSARLHLERAAILAPDEGLHHLELGIALRDMRLQAEARKALEKAVELADRSDFDRFHAQRASVILAGMR
jgi:tetratricopeptide (TPR) repeat protein